MKWTKWKIKPSCTTVTPKTGKPVSVLPARVAALVLTTSSTFFPSQQLSALEYSLKQHHQFEFGFRPRVAYLEGQEDAREFSALFRASVSSDWTPSFSTLLELDYVELGWENQFSNGANFNNFKPVIPDVGGFDLNQALLRWELTNTWQLTAGREALNWGNERFIGTNGFWQNEQTLDVLGFRYRFGDASYVSYRYLDNANRINGDDAGKRLNPSDSNFDANNGVRPPAFLGDHEHDSHLLFAEIKEWDHSLVQLYYFDMNINDALPLSNQTLGARYEYKGRINRWRTQAHGELALQERGEVNSGQYMPYYNLGAGAGLGSSELSVQFELLGESNNVGFVTPLSSLHDMNGWADKFLLTPGSGLQDYSVQYIWRSSPWKLDARYHLFNKADNGDFIGHELDLSLTFKFDQDNQLLLTFADFQTADSSYDDERRVFLQFVHNL